MHTKEIISVEVSTDSFGWQNYAINQHAVILLLTAALILIITTTKTLKMATITVRVYVIIPQNQYLPL